MRRTRKNPRKALKALALGVATAAIFTTTASAQVRSEAASKSSSEISYLSWGATSSDLGPFAAQQVVKESVASGGSVAGIPDGDNYVASLARSAGVLGASAAVSDSQAKESVASGGSVAGIPDGDNYVANLARSAGVLGASAVVSDASEGVTPSNLARAYHPIEQGVAQPDGFQPQLQGDEQVIVRDRPDGFQPQTKTVASSTVSASSHSVDRGDLALGFGLGLILATAGAIALAMTRDRQRTGMAHS